MLVKMGTWKFAKWLYSLGNIDVHMNGDHAYIYAVRNGHKHIVHWLKSLDHIER